MEGSILSRFQLDMGLSSNFTGNSASEIDSAHGTDGASTWSPSRRAPSSDHELSSDLENPFTPSQYRRPRAASDENAIPERELKRRKEFAEKICTEMELPAQSLHAFSQMKESDMLIELRASIISLQQMSQKDETRKYIASEEFKDVLKERLRCCLLSPNLTGYVIGAASHILGYAKKNLRVFKIPEKAVQDPEMLEDISTMVKELLTSQHSNIKQKLANSIKAQNHISVLARTMAPSSYFEVTLNHWARYAFLRSSMVTFNHLVEEGTAAIVARKQASRNTNTVNRLGAQEEAAAGGTTTADEAPAETSANESGEKKIWSSHEFWEFIHRYTSQSVASSSCRESGYDSGTTEDFRNDVHEVPSDGHEIVPS